MIALNGRSKLQPEASRTQPFTDCGNKIVPSFISGSQMIRDGMLSLSIAFVTLSLRSATSLPPFWSVDLRSIGFERPATC
jgi:hypothetical protein